MLKLCMCINHNIITGFLRDVFIIVINLILLSNRWVDGNPAT